MPVEQQVFRLKITIDDVLSVEVIKRQCDFSSVELGNRVGESLSRSAQLSEQPPGAILPATFSAS